VSKFISPSIYRSNTEKKGYKLVINILPSNTVPFFFGGGGGGGGGGDANK
jgi:hypothetical protein